MQENILIIMVKAPRPGAVKTRLALTLGAEAACAAYRKMVETLLARLETTAKVELCFTPDNAGEEIKTWLRQDWRASAQGDGDLGARLHRAFLRAFDRGAKQVAIIGSDCPELTAQDLEEAWDALHSHDVVLGPATDGGYWLIALRAPAPELFNGISWSTEAVCRQTLDRCRTRGLSAHRLRELADIDTAADWRRFLARAG